MKKSRKIAFFVSVLWIVGGCAWGTVPGHVREPMYNWGFYNPSQEVLQEVKATYQVGDVRDTPGAGWLRQGSSGRHGPGLEPIPPMVTVSWKTPDDQRHQIALEVASQIPDLEQFSGTIYFVYLGPDHGWKVVPLTAQEQHEQAIRARQGTLGQRNPLVPTPDKYLPSTGPTTQPVDDAEE